MEVKNLNGYKNQFLITDKEKTVFQSYDYKIAEFNNETNTLKIYSEWSYSNTTMRHFKAFINTHTTFNYENKAQWIKEIKNNNNIEVQ